MRTVKEYQVNKTHPAYRTASTLVDYQPSPHHLRPPLAPAPALAGVAATKTAASTAAPASRIGLSAHRTTAVCSPTDRRLPAVRSPAP